MIKLVINADDFGYSTEINRAIIQLIGTNKLTSATAMANAPAFEQAATESHKWPDCSFGLHLVLTEFFSLSQHPALLDAGIVDENWEFIGEEKLLSIKPSVALINAVIDEWSAQYMRAIDCGMQISHVDSHQHVHTIPWLFPALKLFQRKYSISTIRTTKNLYSDLEPPPSKKLMLSKKIWHLALRNAVRTKTTDYFTSFNSFLSLMKSDSVPTGTLEVMCHPGHQSFREETNLLLENWEASNSGEFELVSYYQI